MTRHCKLCLDGVVVWPERGNPLQATPCECLAKCPHCGGTGYWVRKDPLQREFAQDCVCYAPRLQAQRVNQAMLPARYADATLQDSTIDADNREVIHALRIWVKEYAPHKRGLVLMGMPGVGKTWLAAALLRALIAQHTTQGLFQDFSELLGALRQGYSNNQAENVVTDPLIQAEVLLIDELGKGRNTPWEQSIIDSLITARYNARRMCIFTTNYAQHAKDSLPETYRNKAGPHEKEDLTLQESLAERIGARLYSRLQETCDFFLLKGRDRRTMARP